jgi:hypothetical protein
MQSTWPCAGARAKYGEEGQLAATRQFEQVQSTFKPLLSTKQLEGAKVL